MKVNNEMILCLYYRKIIFSVLYPDKSDTLVPIDTPIFGKIVAFRVKMTFCVAQLMCRRVGGSLVTLTEDQLNDASMNKKLNEFLKGLHFILNNIIICLIFCRTWFWLSYLAWILFE